MSADAEVPEAGEVATFELLQNVNYLLRRAHSRADQVFNEVMSDLGVTPRQAALLYGVQRCAGGSISKLTQLTGMDRGTLSEMVPRLVRRGLIDQRRAESDGRAMALALTDDGQVLVRRLRERTPEVQRRVLATLPPEYHELFRKMLSLMIGLETETRTRVTEHDLVSGLVGVPDEASPEGRAEGSG